MARNVDDIRLALTLQGIGDDAAVSATIGRESRPPAPSREPLPGEHTGEFAVLGELGRGGMATVFLARQTALDRDVAIKRPTRAGDRDAEAALLREAVTMGQLEHPNIVPVHALLAGAEGCAVVMKRVSGASLRELIARGELTLERQLDIVLQVSNAVSFAHDRGVIHRDIKPENVMLGPYGEVYLLDWGVALRKSDPPSDQIVGTPCCMAPEMVHGRADERTDVFLLGAMLHELITRHPRHAGDTPLAALVAAMTVEPYAYASDVPEELARIVNEACARAPEERYESAAELRDALLSFREHRTASALTDAAEERLRRFSEATLPGEARVYDEVQELFHEARFAFEAALRVWPDSARARERRALCIGAMIDHELALRHADAASALLAALPEPDPARAERLAVLRAEQQTEQETFARSVRDRDPMLGAHTRATAYTAILTTVLVITLGLAVQRELFPSLRRSTPRLCFVAGVVLFLMVAVVAWWRKHGAWNLINQRIATVSIATLAVSFASRVSGVLVHAEPERVLITDAFLFALGSLAVSAYHRAGKWLAALSFLVGLLGSVWPGAVEDLFIAFSVCVPSTMLLLRRRAPRS